NYDATLFGLSAFWLILAVTFFFADGGFAIVGPYAAEVWPSHLRTTGMGSAYGFGGIGKIIGPVGLALIVGSNNYLKPDVPLTVIARAEAVRADVAAASDDIENTRRLPPAVLDRLHEAQLFRLLLPRSTNGIETDPVTFFHVIETIAKADASAAWCLSQAGGCAMSAAYLDLPVAQASFGDPRAGPAWGPGPRGRAVECAGGSGGSGLW